jgi:uncharacterized protein
MATIPDYLVPSRLAKRADYDKDTIYAILDEALVCTISYAVDNRPYSIPTAFARFGDKLYIHGSVGSHFIRALETGIPVCISVTLMDALVVAKSAFHHSVNYRSVIVFSQAEKVEPHAEKEEALMWVVNKIVPNSWDYLRPMKETEVRKTTVLSFSLAEASAKLRSGMPIDDEEDMALPIWSGLIPLETKRGTPIPDESSKFIALPTHLKGA